MPSEVYSAILPVQSKTWQTGGAPIRESGNTGALAEGNEPSDGTIPEARVPASGPGLYRPVPALLSNESARDPSGLDDSHVHVEEGHGSEQSQQTSTSGSLPTGLPNHFGQDAGTGQGVSEQPRMGTGGQAPSDHARGEMALLAMVQRDEKLQADHQTTPRHGEDGETFGGLGGGGSVRTGINGLPTATMASEFLKAFLAYTRWFSPMSRSRSWIEVRPFCHHP